MRIAFFYHSIVSDWNHGNAHFLRGITTELMERGHAVHIFEPADGWSLTRLLKDHGFRPLAEFHRRFPDLESTPYTLDSLDLDRMLNEMDLVLVHEWNTHELVKRIGAHRKRSDYRLFFHDTHHRSVSEPHRMQAYDLSGYDGVLAYGETIRRIYLKEGWARRVWTWHEAADTRVFHPPDHTVEKWGDLVWIGNWGDEERTVEYSEFLIEPVRELDLSARSYGVQYPLKAIDLLRQNGIEYSGWLANYLVPEVFSHYRVTLHIPRRPYVEALPGIPTIRPFEALACGIPLVCARWEDTERLFTPGKDFLIARDKAEMKSHIQKILSDEPFARALAEHGYRTILERHTCAHRVDELMDFCRELGMDMPRNEKSSSRIAKGES